MASRSFTINTGVGPRGPAGEGFPITGPVEFDGIELVDSSGQIMTPGTVGNEVLALKGGGLRIEDGTNSSLAHMQHSGITFVKGDGVEDTWAVPLADFKLHQSEAPADGHLVGFQGEIVILVGSFEDLDVLELQLCQPGAAQGTYTTWDFTGMFPATGDLSLIRIRFSPQGVAFASGEDSYFAFGVEGVVMAFSGGASNTSPDEEMRFVSPTDPYGLYSPDADGFYNLSLKLHVHQTVPSTQKFSVDHSLNMVFANTIGY